MWGLPFYVCHLSFSDVVFWKQSVSPSHFDLSFSLSLLSPWSKLMCSRTSFSCNSFLTDSHNWACGMQPSICKAVYIVSARDCIFCILNPLRLTWSNKNAHFMPLAGAAYFLILLFYPSSTQLLAVISLPLKIFSCHDETWFCRCLNSCTVPPSHHHFYHSPLKPFCNSHHGSGSHL